MWEQLQYQRPAGLDPGGKCNPNASNAMGCVDSSSHSIADSDKSVCSPHNWKWGARSSWLTLVLSGTAPLLPTRLCDTHLMLWSLNQYCIKSIPILLWGPHLLNSLAKKLLWGHGEAVRIWPRQSLRRWWKEELASPDRRIAVFSAVSLTCYCISALFWESFLKLCLFALIQCYWNFWTEIQVISRMNINILCLYVYKRYSLSS